MLLDDLESFVQKQVDCIGLCSSAIDFTLYFDNNVTQCTQLLRP